MPSNQKLREVTNRYYKRNVHFVTEPRIARICLERNWKRIRDGKLTYAVVDTETTSLDPWADWAWYYSKQAGKVVSKDWGGRVFSIQFGFYDEVKDRLDCVYVDVEDEESMDVAFKILSWRALTLVGHNIKFDIQMSHVSGIPFKCKIWDTLTASRLTHDRLPKHDLKWLGNFFSGRDGKHADKWEDEVKRWLTRTKTAHTREGFPKDYVNYSFVPDEIMKEYALKDIWYTFLLYTVLQDEVYATYKDAFAIELEVIWYLVRMERRGVRINRAVCVDAIRKLDKVIAEMDERIDLHGLKNGNPLFNPNSPKQLKEMLIASGIPEKALTRKGGGLTSGGGGGTKGDITKVSTARAVLERTMVDYPQAAFLRDVITVRTAQKVRNTYFESIHRRSIVGDIIHCNIKASDTATGRVACVNPNLQNIPRPQFAVVLGAPPVRKAFIARDGFRDLYFDYSQIEMRLFALFCREQAMLDAFVEGRDLHTESAVLMFGKDIDEYMDENGCSYDDAIKHFRRKSKILNFAILYGMGLTKLAFELGVTFNEAKKLMEQYLEKFPRIPALIDEIKKCIQRYGFVEGIFGRRYHLPKDKAYIAINALMQGDAAMVLKVAQLQTERLIRKIHMEEHVFPTLVIHDEQKVEICNQHAEWIAPLIKLAMEDIPCVAQYGIKTTVDVEYSHPAWDGKHNWKTSKQDMALAQRWWDKHREEVVIPWNRYKVDWFLEDIVV